MSLGVSEGTQFLSKGVLGARTLQNTLLFLFSKHANRGLCFWEPNGSHIYIFHLWAAVALEGKHSLFQAHHVPTSYIQLTSDFRSPGLSSPDVNVASSAQNTLLKTPQTLASDKNVSCACPS